MDAPTAPARRPRVAVDVAALLGLAALGLLLPVISGDSAPLGVPVLGLVAAAALALHGAGVVLVYRADRCLNLAQVQIGVAAAVLFGALVQGRPLLRAAEAACPPCVGEPGPVMSGANYAVAAAIALAAAAGLGWLVHAAVIRRLKGSPPVVLTVATVFVVQMLAGLQARLPGWLTTREQRQQGLVGGVVTPPFDVTWKVGGTVLHLADLLLVATAVAGVAGLAVWLSRTPAGRDLRAAAGDAERARTLGIDAGRAAGRAWMWAGLLSGVAGVLAAASLGVGQGGEGTLAAAPLVRILAVAVAARLFSLPLVALAALALGQIDQAVTWVYGTATPLDGVLVLLVGGLLMLQRRASAGGDRDEAAWDAVRAPRAVPAVMAGLPEVRRARTALAVAGVVAAAAFPWLASPAQSGLAAVAAASAVIGLSTLIVVGWAGQVSLGQLAFAAIGAALAGATHLPLPLALVVGAAGGAATAVAVGIPALRLRGAELAVVTLALALSVTAAVLNPKSLGSLVGRVGGDGLPLVDIADPRAGWYVAVLVAGGAAVVVARFRSSRLGRALVASRDHDAAASSFGIDPVRARLAGFAIAGAMAAGAGVLLAHLQGSVASESYTPAAGLAAFTATVLGGLGSVAGPVLGFGLMGALAVAAAPVAVVNLVTGAGGLALLLAAPGGLVQVMVSIRDGTLRRVARRRRMDVPGLSAGGSHGQAPIAEPRELSRVPDYRLVDQWGVVGRRD